MADTCVFNLYVTCSPENCNKCDKCGWNPKVEENRKKAVKRK